MSDVSRTHSWCEICTANPGSHEVHESPAISVPSLPSTVHANPRTMTQVSYVDGDREPQMYIGNDGETDMTADQVEQLIAMLQDNLRLMRSIQPTSLPAGCVPRG